MTATRLITYDLNKPGQDYSELLKFIKSHPYAKLSESSYAILTDSSPQFIYDSIKKYLDKNDTLYVINLKKPFWGQGSKEVNDWLTQNLQF